MLASTGLEFHILSVGVKEIDDPGSVRNASQPRLKRLSI